MNAEPDRHRLSALAERLVAKGWGLLALVLLSPKVAELTKSYFERKPWIQNREAHRKIVEERRAARKDRGRRS